MGAVIYPLRIRPGAIRANPCLQYGFWVVKSWNCQSHIICIIFNFQTPSCFLVFFLIPCCKYTSNPATFPGCKRLPPRTCHFIKKPKLCCDFPLCLLFFFKFFYIFNGFYLYFLLFCHKVPFSILIIVLFTLFPVLFF